MYWAFVGSSDGLAFASSVSGAEAGTRVWSARRRRCSRRLRRRRTHHRWLLSRGSLASPLLRLFSFWQHLGAVSHAIASLPHRRSRVRSASSVDLGRMDPEDLSESEEENEDDDLMLFILPALYLSYTEMASPDRASTGTAQPRPRNSSKRIIAPGRTTKITATPEHASETIATPDHASEGIAAPGSTSKRKRKSTPGGTSRRKRVPKPAGAEPPVSKKRSRNVEWVCKVLEDDRAEGYDKLKVKPQVLEELSVYLRSNNLLQHTKGASVEEKVGMFIYMLSRNSSFHKLAKRFEYSTETIHRHIKSCFDAVASLTSEFVKPPSTEPHWKISSDQHYGPYFENCIGAIDGIHVPMNIADVEAAPYRNRKESISQNVMLACDFDWNFVYVSCGREGSASDAAVLYSAIESGFQVPEGKYYLVDGGYPNTQSFLAPYIGVPYPTEEQEQSSFQPRNYMELFNLRHAQLRNHIRHAIGLLRTRFPILNVATGFRKDTQLRIPAAAVVMHNVFQRHRGDNEQLSNQMIPFPVAPPSGDEIYGYDVEALNSQAYLGDALRDGIALRMWADYEREIHTSNLGAFVWNSENNQLV